MTNAIGDIISRKSNPEPPEFQAIKAYVRTHYQANCSVAVKSGKIVITVTSAALAGTLRLHIIDLQRVAKLPTRPIIRIGS